jgi:DNA polymerase III gamma/tau subunit
VGLPTSYIINADKIETIKSAARHYCFEDLEQNIIQIDRVYRLIEQNVNPKIVLEVMLAKMAKRIFF